MSVFERRSKRPSLAGKCLFSRLFWQVLPGAQTGQENIILFLGDAGGLSTLHAASIHTYGEPDQLASCNVCPTWRFGDLVGLGLGDGFGSRHDGNRHRDKDAQWCHLPIARRSSREG